LDRGLGDIRAYPPGSHAGIVVLHLTDGLLRIRHPLTGVQRIHAMPHCLLFIARAGFPK
jgi:hypothetical protein